MRYRFYFAQNKFVCKQIGEHSEYCHLIFPMFTRTNSNQQTLCAHGSIWTKRFILLSLFINYKFSHNTLCMILIRWEWPGSGSVSYWMWMRRRRTRAHPHKYPKTSRSLCVYVRRNFSHCIWFGGFWRLSHCMGENVWLIGCERKWEFGMWPLERYHRKVMDGNSVFSCALRTRKKKEPIGHSNIRLSNKWNNRRPNECRYIFN